MPETEVVTLARGGRFLRDSWTFRSCIGCLRQRVCMCWDSVVIKDKCARIHGLASHWLCYSWASVFPKQDDMTSFEANPSNTVEGCEVNAALAT